MTGHYKTHLFFACTMLITFYRYKHKKWFNMPLHVEPFATCGSQMMAGQGPIVENYDCPIWMSRTRGRTVWLHQW